MGRIQVDTRRAAMLSGKIDATAMGQIFQIGGKLMAVYCKRMGSNPFHWNSQPTLIDLFLGRITLGEAMGQMALHEPMFRKVKPSPRQQKQLDALITQLKGEFPGYWRQGTCAFAGRPDKVANVCVAKEITHRAENRIRIKQLQSEGNNVHT